VINDENMNMCVLAGRDSCHVSESVVPHCAKSCGTRSVEGGNTCRDCYQNGWNSRLGHATMKIGGGSD
jgi:hypothetical protein